MVLFPTIQSANEGLRLAENDNAWIIVDKLKIGEDMTNQEFIGKYLAFLYRDNQKFLDRELEPYNIGAGQFYLLMPLFGTDGVNQESLSRTIKVDKATITRSIQKLVEEGYVIRQKDDEDKRSYRVFLTEKGRRIEPDIRDIALRVEEILLSGFDENQRILVKDFIQVMIRNVSGTMDEYR